jgi:predicted naringenin-chalcone synthase
MRTGEEDLSIAAPVIIWRRGWNTSRHRSVTLAPRLDNPTCSRKPKGLPVTQAWLNRIGTAVPLYDIHAAFVEFGRDTITDWRKRALFDRMAALSDIRHRYAIFEPGPKPRDKVLDAAGFYRRGAFPTTAARMALYEPHALDLAMRAVQRLDADPNAFTHLIVASCTGFTAPGLDFQLMRAAGLPDGTQRTIVGFMGCFAAVNALKLADQVVRADPGSRVLVVNLELCSLHLQEDFQDVAKMLSFLLFADGASAALVTAQPGGIALGGFRSTVIPRSHDLITWRIGDNGFEMQLSGQVPGRIRRWLPEHGAKLVSGDAPALWAVHAGGRSILDAVQHGVRLAPDALRYSREILCNYGNMSSATLMFVLDRILADTDASGPGLGMAFGPGLSVETFAFARP